MINNELDLEARLDSTCYDTIYVDIDVKYDFFQTSDLFNIIKENLRLLDGWKIFSAVYIRRSSSNNVHLRLNLAFGVGFEESMIIRSLLHDDPYRLAIDMRRIVFQDGEECNRIFSSKNGRVAGDWQLLQYKEDEQCKICGKIIKEESE